MFRLVLPAVALLLPLTPVLAADPVSGRWLTHNGKAVVEIGACGSSLCGRVVRIVVPPRDGRTTDSRNPDPALRDRPMLGLPILTGFTADGDEWRGRAYNPDAGRSYRSTLRLNPDGTLRVRGCVALFCKSLTWTRAR